MEFLIIVTISTIIAATSAYLEFGVDNSGTTINRNTSSSD